MSDRRHRQIKEAADAAVRPLMADAQRAIIAQIAESFGDVALAVGKVQPAHIDLTQELADDITRKLRGPLTIPEEMSDWLREEAKFHDVPVFSRLGYSRAAADAIWTLKADGTIQLEIRRNDGARWWLGVFGPPDKS